MTVLLDIIIALVVIEAGIVIWRRLAKGQARALPGDLSNLGSGLCLMLAVRLAWTNSPALVVILLVTLAGAAHAFDMMQRFRTVEPAQKKTPQLGASATDSEHKRL